MPTIGTQKAAPVLERKLGWSGKWKRSVNDDADWAVGAGCFADLPHMKSPG